MKFPLRLVKSHSSIIRWVSLAWMAALPLAAQAAATPGAPAKPAPSGTNSAVAEPVIAQSVFVMPSNPQEGRDPFFPRSMHPYASAALIRPNQTNAPQAVITDVHLNGTSGGAGKPLAIINNKTFEIGEEGDIVCNGSHVRIRCLDIKADTAVIQIGAERRVLRMRAGL